MPRQARLIASSLLMACASALLAVTSPVSAASKHFVLVHGAWHTGAAWDGVIDGLRKRGYTAEAITLPGYGPNNGDPSTTTLADDTAALVNLLNKQTEPVILVAHSAGGVVVQQAVPKAVSKVQEVARVVSHSEFTQEEPRVCARAVSASLVTAQNWRSW
jgi:alpha-beta hydrolase superfamily lysophospholipase